MTTTRSVFLASVCFTMALTLVTLAGCSKPEDAPQGALAGRLVLTGSSTVAPLAAEIAKRFESRHPAVRVDVQTGGSSRGVADARRGTADIGMVSRALKPEEADLAAHTIALDGISIILHRDNPIPALTDEQIVAIYTGRITRWNEVGGRNERITVVNKAEGHSTLELFLGHFKLKSEDIRADIVIGDNQQGIQTVAGDPHAIGYISIGTAAYESAHGTAIRTVPMAGVAPTLANVRNRRFPLSRPLNLVTRGDLSPLQKAFIAFATSSTVHDLVEVQYFVPLAD